MILRRKKKGSGLAAGFGQGGQTSLEYAMIIIIVVGALLTIQNYMKRGIQGRWKGAVDNLGEQYDPRTADTRIRQTIVSTTNTTIVAMNTAGGFWTKRTDASVTRERKTGYTSVGAY